MYLSSLYQCSPIRETREGHAGAQKGIPVPKKLGKPSQNLSKEMAHARKRYSQLDPKKQRGREKRSRMSEGVRWCSEEEPRPAGARESEAAEVRVATWINIRAKHVRSQGSDMEAQPCIKRGGGGGVWHG